MLIKINKKLHRPKRKMVVKDTLQNKIQKKHLSNY